jgi:hypothetical protein
MPAQNDASTTGAASDQYQAERDCETCPRVEDCKP